MRVEASLGAMLSNERLANETFQHSGEITDCLLKYASLFTLFFLCDEVPLIRVSYTSVEASAGD